MNYLHEAGWQARQVRPDLPRKGNSNKTPLCIQRAPLGTHERFIGFLIESRACGTGNPALAGLWLAPDQVRVSTLNDAKR